LTSGGFRIVSDTLVKIQFYSIAVTFKGHSRSLKIIGYVILRLNWDSSLIIRQK